MTELGFGNTLEILLKSSDGRCARCASTAGMKFMLGAGADVLCKASVLASRACRALSTSLPVDVATGSGGIL